MTPVLVFSCKLWVAEHLRMAASYSYMLLDELKCLIQFHLSRGRYNQVSDKNIVVLIVLTF